LRNPLRTYELRKWGFKKPLPLADWLGYRQLPIGISIGAK